MNPAASLLPLCSFDAAKLCISFQFCKGWKEKFGKHVAEHKIKGAANSAFGLGNLWPKVKLTSGDRLS